MLTGPNCSLKDWSPRRALVVCALTMFPLAWAAAQSVDPATVDRSRLLAESGSVETLQTPFKLFPLTGQVTRFPANFKGTSIRLHFRVAPPQPSTASAPVTLPKWTVDIVDSQNETKKLWSRSPDPDETEFWSGQLFSSKVTILISTEEPDKVQRVSIDRVARFTPQSKDLSMTSNQLAPISGQPSEIKAWGKAVAKLVVVRDDNQQTFNCTGFLIAPDLLITNRHCSESGSEARSVSAQFDFDTPGEDPPPEAQVGVKEMVLSSCDLDFAILRLEKAVPFFPGDDRKPLKLGIPGTVPFNQSLLVIQHPSGLAKQVSIVGCALTKETMIGNSSLSTDFGHGCDTNKSSSGSPIQIIGSTPDQNGRVVGIHHLGFRIDNAQKDTPDPINRAVRIKLITDYIKNNNPALAKELNIPL